MTKAIEINTEITADHAIHLKLPEHVRATKARVIVLYDQGEEVAEGNLDAFLEALPTNSVGRDHRSIMNQLNQERASWV